MLARKHRAPIDPIPPPPPSPTLPTPNSTTNNDKLKIQRTFVKSNTEVSIEPPGYSRRPTPTSLFKEFGICRQPLHSTPAETYCCKQHLTACSNVYFRQNSSQTTALKRVTYHSQSVQGLE